MCSSSPPENMSIETEMDELLDFLESRLPLDDGTWYWAVRQLARITGTPTPSSALQLLFGKFSRSREDLSVREKHLKDRYLYEGSPEVPGADTRRPTWPHAVPRGWMYPSNPEQNRLCQTR